MSEAKRSILILCDYYLPTTKGRGPAKSIASVAGTLKNLFNIYVLTRDRDYGSSSSYAGVIPGAWNDVDGINVRYLQYEELKHFRLKKIIGTINFDAVYLNSFFSIDFTVKTLLFRRAGWKTLKEAPIILAPRGELSDDAICIKKRKKIIYLALSKMANLYRNIVFHAESHREVKEIQKNSSMFIDNFSNNRITYASCPLKKSITTSIYRPEKRRNHLRICSMSRISRIKNIDFAIKILERIFYHTIEFDIYGPSATPEDKAYLAECMLIAERLPKNISVRFMGPTEPDSVTDVIAGYHLFFLPTHSENFGHAIFEALSAGRPVLISDQTPWLDLELKNIGWDISLNKPQEFEKVISHLASTDTESYSEIIDSIIDFLDQKNIDDTASSMIREMFISSLKPETENVT